MCQLKKVFFILFLTFLGCKKQTKEQKFISDNNLQRYDSIYVISCISCGGCIDEYRRIHFPRLNANKGVLVFDDQCKNAFMKQLLIYPHVSISQDHLDSVFDNFGNIVLLSKKPDNTYLSTTPFN